MWKIRLSALGVLVFGVLVGFFVYAGGTNLHHPKWFDKYPFKLGLDLSGGTHLVYRADVSRIPAGDIADSMASVRDVIERRINTLGVSEPSITTEDASFATNNEQRLVVDLPNVTDVQQAVALIGQTPLLEFKTENPNAATEPQKVTVGKDGKIQLNPDANKYIDTELTGRYLQKATLTFDQTTNEPVVSLQFNDAGAKLFEDITRANVGKTVAIFLDGAPISTPVVREAITGGQAQISGNFKLADARTLVGRLNSGALPVPIELISTETIGPTLGAVAVKAGLLAGMLGFLIIGMFLIAWYRLPGVIAVLGLSMYVAISLALFKLIPVTLTAAGLAGFVISIGIAVDANVLIFERIKEELRAGRTVAAAIDVGFKRAWTSIRDSNISSLITAVILFWFGTSLIKGFALTFGLGVIISMISAISITRLFIRSLGLQHSTKLTNFLFGSGISSASSK